MSYQIATSPFRATFRALAVVAPVFAIFACTVNAPISAPINATFPASADEVRSCRDSCAKQNTSACFDAAGFTSCESACDAASSTGATTFVQCVSSAVCNAKCDSDLKASPAPVDGGASSGGPTPDGGPLADSAGGDGSVPPADTGTDAPSADVQQCIAACASPLAKSCYEVPTMQQQCVDACGQATPAASSTFVNCTLTQTDCSTFFNATCYGAIAG
jgi:hypothetical protein